MGSGCRPAARYGSRNGACATKRCCPPPGHTPGGVLSCSKRTQRSKLRTAMSDLPVSQYIEASGDGYHLAGTRISLDSIAYAVSRGETIEEILADFPALQSRQTLKEPSTSSGRIQRKSACTWRNNPAIGTTRARQILPISPKRREDIVRKGISNPLEGPSAGRRGPPVRDRPRYSNVGARH